MLSRLELAVLLLVAQRYNREWQTYYSRAEVANVVEVLNELKQKLEPEEGEADRNDAQS
jgi:hypothetical protein